MQYKGYIDNVKKHGSRRLISMNTHRCSSTSERKMNNSNKAIKGYYIDILMLNEVNTK